VSFLPIPPLAPLEFDGEDGDGLPEDQEVEVRSPPGVFSRQHVPIGIGTEKTVQIGIRRRFHIGLRDKSSRLEVPRQLFDQSTSDIGLDVLQRPVLTAAEHVVPYPEVLTEPEVSEDEDGDDDHPDDGEQGHSGPPA
jgi:hypothetical protein